MADRNQTTASAEQQELGHLVRQGTTEQEQGVYEHDFDDVPMGCMKQVCSAGDSARAQRNKKPERQQRQETVVADLRREKRQLMGEIRLRDLTVQQKELCIQELGIRIRKMDLEQRTLVRNMTREHQAELAGREHTETILLGDLRELCQSSDEEVEELRRTIDRQALPPAYDQINNQAQVDSVIDVASANATAVLSSAKATLRRAIAESSDRPDRLFRVAQGFFNAIASITRAKNKVMWPVNCTFQILDAIYEMCSRVSQCITLSEEDDSDAPARARPSPSRRLLSCLDTTKRAHRTLRKAFLNADSLASEVIPHHFSSGGRRAGLFAVAVPHFHCPLHGTVDLEDGFQELQFWKRRFDGVKREMLDWKDDVGVVVFGASVARLEQIIMSAV